MCQVWPWLAAGCSIASLWRPLPAACRSTEPLQFTRLLPLTPSPCRPRVILWHHAVTFLLLQIPLKHPSLGVYTCYVSFQLISALLSVLHVAWLPLSCEWGKFWSPAAPQLVQPPATAACSKRARGAERRHHVPAGSRPALLLLSCHQPFLPQLNSSLAGWAD